MTIDIADLPTTVSLIPLPRGNHVIVDTVNMRLLNVHRWSLADKGARRYAKRRKKDGKFVYMHREILDAPDGMQIDHVNGNGLDNRVANLRLCTATQNQRNAVKRANCSSRFKGVDWNKRQKKWRARITINKRTILIGRYCDEFRAAKAYDKKAIELFGEFANINFPSQKTKLINEKNRNENVDLD